MPKIIYSQYLFSLIISFSLPPQDSKCSLLADSKDFNSFLHLLQPSLVKLIKRIISLLKSFNGSTVPLSFQNKAQTPCCYFILPILVSSSPLFFRHPNFCCSPMHHVPSHSLNKLFLSLGSHSPASPILLQLCFLSYPVHGSSTALNSQCYNFLLVCLPLSSLKGA